jgi:hypothetical protein
VFSGTAIIEPYLLSTLIHKKTVGHLFWNYAISPNDTVRYLAKNASFHISRIASFLWRGNDNWMNIASVKKDLFSFIESPDIDAVFGSHIDSAVTILFEIVNNSHRHMSDLNSALKSAELDNEINRKIHSNPEIALELF